ncbi:MAG: HAD-IIIA family hydrolase [Alcaligenaceae bacterium]
MTQYSVIVFDWDGTLMDSTHGIVQAIQGACRDLELNVPSAAQAAWVIGLSLEPALRHAVPDLTKSLEPLFLERYRHHYLGRDQTLKLFEGIPELLADLKAKGATLAVATGKSRVGLNRALTSTALHSTFQASRTADETFGKPHPGMLLELMDELMVEPSQVVMIGDTSHDLKMAANAGVHGLGVAYGGAHPADELRACPNQGVVERVADLRTWLFERLA